MQQRNVILAIIASVLIIALTIFILTRLNSGVGNSGPNTAERTATNFYASIAAQDYAKTYSFLATQQQADLTLYSFTQVAQVEDAMNGKVTTFHEIRYDRDTNDSNKAAIQMQVTRARAGTYTIKLTLVQSADGTWKILEEDRPI